MLLFAFVAIMLYKKTRTLYSIDKNNAEQLNKNVSKIKYMAIALVKENPNNKKIKLLTDNIRNLDGNMVHFVKKPPKK